MAMKSQMIGQIITMFIVADFGMSFFSPDRAPDGARRYDNLAICLVFPLSPGVEKRRKHESSGRHTTYLWQRHDAFYVSCFCLLFVVSMRFHLAGRKVENA